jgi:hypothetical protein
MAPRKDKASQGKAPSQGKARRLGKQGMSRRLGKATQE